MLERDGRGPPHVAEQVGGTASFLRTNRRAALVIVAVVALALGSILDRPVSIGLSDVVVGDCLFVRTPSAVNYLPSEVPIGPVAEVRGALASGAAERTRCEGSHGHEVSAVIELEDPADAAHPGEDALLARVTATCEAAFAGFVGRDREGSAYDTVAVVPSRPGWSGGERRAACLVFGRDGRFLDHQARGSGE